MNIKDLQKNWNSFGREDPLWAILVEPGKEGRKWNADEFFATGVSEIDSLMNQFQMRQLSLEKGRALDFGCGVGRLTQALSSHFQEVCGVDVAESMLEHARSYNRYGNRCKYLLNESSNLSQFSDGYFNFVYSNLVLQHMHPALAKSYIREFVRVLSPDGILVFQQPSENPNPPGVPGFKLALRKMLPNVFLRGYWKLKGKLFKRGILSIFSSNPEMEMYTIEPNEIRQLLSESGALLIDVTEGDARCSGDWLSWVYWAKKKGLA